MLSVNILIHKNTSRIKPCLNAVRTFASEIIVGNLGASEQILQECGSSRIIECDSMDFSAARNQLIEASKNNWILWVEPWEITKGALPSTPGKYRVNVVRNSILLKETRLITKQDRFRNPCFETVSGGAFTGSLAVNSSDPEYNPDYGSILNDWIKNRPTDSEACYYEAQWHLSHKRFDSFKKAALQALSHDPQKFMTLRYQLANVLLYRENKYDDAVMQTLVCMHEKPSLPEYWCLLGDVYYLKKDFFTAAQMYESAMVMAKHRDLTDEYPIDPDKYGPYPQKMSKICRDLCTNSAAV